MLLQNSVWFRTVYYFSSLSFPSPRFSTNCTDWYPLNKKLNQVVRVRTRVLLSPLPKISTNIICLWANRNIQWTELTLIFKPITNIVISVMLTQNGYGIWTHGYYPETIKRYLDRYTLWLMEKYQKVSEKPSRSLIELGSFRAVSSVSNICMLLTSSKESSVPVRMYLLLWSCPHYDISLSEQLTFDDRHKLFFKLDIR